MSATHAAMNDAENIAPVEPRARAKKGLGGRRIGLGRVEPPARPPPAAAPGPVKLRRVLGDITNLPDSGVAGARGGKIAPVARQIPRDAAGNVEEPEYTPVTKFMPWTEPVIELDDEGVVSRENEDEDGKDLFDGPRLDAVEMPVMDRQMAYDDFEDDMLLRPDAGTEAALEASSSQGPFNPDELFSGEELPELELA